jgi:hypothetical protein
MILVLQIALGVFVAEMAMAVVSGVLSWYMNHRLRKRVHEGIERMLEHVSVDEDDNTVRKGQYL